MLLNWRCNDLIQSSYMEIDNSKKGAANTTCSYRFIFFWWTAHAASLPPSFLFVNYTSRFFFSRCAAER